MQLKGLLGFYSKSGKSGISQGLLPLSATPVEKARTYCLIFKNGMDRFAKMG